MKNFLFLTFLIIFKVASASDTLIISSNFNNYSPHKNYYKLFIDHENKITSETILQDSIQKLFAHSGSSELITQNLEATYWTKFSLKAIDDHKIWLMEIGDPHIQNIDFFELKNNKLVPYSITKGFNHSFSNKDFFHKNFVYLLDLTDGLPHNYYLKFKSTIHNSISIKIRSAEFLISYSLTEYFLLGLYYGILLIMAIYNLFIFFSVKEKTYIYYVLFVIFCGLNSMNEDGLGFQFLWPEKPAINMISMRITQFILLIAFIFYSTSFLKLETKKPLLNKIAHSLVALYFILFIINATVFNFSNNFQLFYLIPYIYIYSVTIYIIYIGYKPARYFLLGYSFVLFGFIIFYLRLLGIEILPSYFTVYSFNFGIILEVVTLSYALSERLREEKMEKENAQQLFIQQLQEQERLKDELNKELETKVEERTAELRLASEEIGRMNKILEKSNLQLQEDVKHISKERIMQREVSLDEFKRTYPNEETCFQFLSDLKWGKKYTCKKCENEKYSTMQNLARRCNKCKYIESVTAFTIFHSIKFSIVEAFYMLFMVNSRKDITAEELSKNIQLSEKSCAAFKKKILNAEKALKGKSKEKSGWERLIPYYEEE